MMSALPLEINGGGIGEFGDVAAGGPDPGSQQELARLLCEVGSSTMVLALVAAFKEPSGVVFKSHKLAYYLTLAVVFAFGMAELITVFCLCRYGSSERVRTWARAVVFVSVGPLVVVIALLGGFAFVQHGIAL